MRKIRERGNKLWNGCESHNSQHKKKWIFDFNFHNSSLFFYSTLCCCWCSGWQTVRRNLLKFSFIFCYFQFKYLINWRPNYRIDFYVMFFCFSSLYIDGIRCRFSAVLFPSVLINLRPPNSSSPLTK